MNKSAWDTLKYWAPFHPSLDDMTTFNHLMDLLQKKQSFHIARYNDGEWVWMLNIPPYYEIYLRTYGGNKGDNISEKLLKIINSRPSYYIGVGSTTRAGKGSISSKKDEINTKLAKLEKLVYGDIFNTATIKLGIEALLHPLRERYVVTVGPEYMKKLNISDTHISVLPEYCWVEMDQIEKKLNTCLKGCLEQQPVILYACSLLAKYLIDVNYHLFENNITQLDLGSCIDPWCGRITRPWHHFLI